MKGVVFSRSWMSQLRILSYKHQQNAVRGKEWLLWWVGKSNGTNWVTCMHESGWEEPMVGLAQARKKR